MSPVTCFNNFIWHLTDYVEFSENIHSLCTVCLNAILNALTEVQQMSNVVQEVKVLKIGKAFYFNDMLHGIAVIFK